MAGILAIKTLDDDDYSFSVGAPRKTIDELATLCFIERVENAVLLGLSGVGRSPPRDRHQVCRDTGRHQDEVHHGSGSDVAARGRVDSSDTTRFFGTTLSARGNSSSMRSAVCRSREIRLATSPRSSSSAMGPGRRSGPETFRLRNGQKPSAATPRDCRDAQPHHAPRRYYPNQRGQRQTETATPSRPRFVIEEVATGSDLKCV